MHDICLVTFYVTRLAGHSVVIVVEHWLLQHNCLGYDDRFVMLRKGEKRITLF